MNKKEYSDEEARQILKRAVDYQERAEFNYTSEQLFDLGREMGLSQDAIVKAERDIRTGTETPVVAKPHTLGSTKAGISEEEAAFRRERMSGFYQHFAVYLATVALLFTINLLTNGLGFPWFLFPAMGWGIGVVAHFMSVGIFQGDSYDDAFEEWLDERKARQSRRQRRLQGAQEE